MEIERVQVKRKQIYSPSPPANMFIHDAV